MVTIKATVPNQKESLFAAAPHLNFAVELPSNLPVDVADTAGPLPVTNTGALRIAGDDAPIDLADIHGDVILPRKHGKLDAQRISGRVREECTHP